MIATTTYRTRQASMIIKKALLVLLVLTAGTLTAQAQVAVIVNKTTDAYQLSERRLLDIYSLEETKWRDGTRIVLFDLKGTDELKEAFYGHLGRRPNDMKRIWLRLILSGEGRAPTQLRTPAGILEQVAQTPGAIGYIPQEMVTDAVRVVRTIPDS